MQTDKLSRPHYMANYKRHFAPFMNHPIRLLELGVLHGGSLELWKSWFPKGEIIGYDFEPPKGLPFKIYEGLQQDTARLSEIGLDFDIIIDDASHNGELTRTSFWTLYPLLNPGGVYVIEDWDSAYKPEERGKKPKPMRDIEGLVALDLITLNVMYGERPEAERWFLKRSLQRIRLMMTRKNIKSHTYGMAGMVKELLDHMELFERIEYSEGQVFIFKP